jgi:REP element-mobilizing transposase RayT
MNENQPPTAPPAQQPPRGWHSRGYLRHFDAGQEFTQFVTFRLADSVPTQVIVKWRDELLSRPEAEREAELHRLIEAFLDTGYGACHLRDERIAALVEGVLFFFDGKRYSLHAWVVMPNHVHALFTPLNDWSLSDIVASWKSFTAKAANKLLGRVGRFWQEDYIDRYVRNEHHFQRVVEYVELNPVKAGLCESPRDWPFGSARWKCSGGAGGTPALHGEQQ